MYFLKVQVLGVQKLKKIKKVIGKKFFNGPLKVRGQIMKFGILNITQKYSKSENNSNSSRKNGLF